MPRTSNLEAAVAHMRQLVESDHLINALRVDNEAKTRLLRINRICSILGWDAREHPSLELFCTGAEKDLVMYQQSVAPQIDDVPASLWKQWPGCTAQPPQLPHLTATRSDPYHGPRQVSPARCLILVVDDHYEIRVALAELLEDEGYQVITAAHGQEALALLRRGTVRPALIVLDLMMPVMDGWTFREIQGSDPLLQAIPVVVISAISNVQHGRHPIPAAAYLPKPLNFALLLETVMRSCRPT